MTGICSQCKEPCDVVIIDFGIGEYEYGGAPGFDSRPDAVSNCCEAETRDEWRFPITLEDLREELENDDRDHEAE